MYYSNNRLEYTAQDDSQDGLSVMRTVVGKCSLSKSICVHCLVLYLAAQEPSSFIATYKTSTSISLEWTFANTPISSYSYVAYYQSGGEGYSVAFTIDSLERDNRHELTGLPVGGVHSISLVAFVDLPSPVAGPVTPGEYVTNNALLSSSSKLCVLQLLRLQ